MPDFPEEDFVGFNAALGMQFAEWRQDYARLTLALEPQHLNRSGVVHGGVLATLLDAACGYSGCYPLEPGRRRRAVTLALTTTYLGQAAGGVITCSATRRGGGRTVFMASGEVRDDADRLLAIGEATYRYIADPPRRP